MNTEEIRKTIGQRVKHYRIMNNLTQMELAAKIGTASKSYITNIEAGAKGIGLERMVELCGFFNITVSDLLPIITKETDNDAALKEKAIFETVDLLKTLNTSQVTMLKSMIAAAVDNFCIIGD